MNANEENVRAAIAAQAADWFVTNDERQLEREESAALVKWLKASPAHVEEFLGVSVIARDLRKACAGPDFSVDQLLERAATDQEAAAWSWRSRIRAALEIRPQRRWQAAGAAVAVIGVLGLGWLVSRTLWPVFGLRPGAPAVEAAALRLETAHGELRAWRLADNSVVHLNTDSVVTVRYDKMERVVVLHSGEAVFEVRHDSGRPFRVLAGTAEVVDLGTRFDVRRISGSTVVTVAEGRVAVGLTRAPGAAGSNTLTGFVPVNAGQQLTVVGDEPPAVPVPADAERTTAWLHRQIMFEREPLELVAAEFNRYSRKPIEITTPALRSLRVSGVFATDNTSGFIAFLRTLEGVHVQVTTTRILVSQN